MATTSVPSLTFRRISSSVNLRQLAWVQGGLERLAGAWGGLERLARVGRGLERRWAQLHQQLVHCCTMRRQAESSAALAGSSKAILLQLVEAEARAGMGKLRVGVCQLAVPKQ